MKYTVKDLRVDFPSEEACLAWLVEFRWPEGIICKNCERITKHHKIKNRKVYSCDRCGRHVSPTAGTIFHKSSTPLTDWFYAIWLMSSNKAGTSAKQLERELGMSYPTAFRMMHRIRSRMQNPEGLFSGEVEIDETFVHANAFKRSSARKRYGYDARRTGSVVLGIVQRGGGVKVWHVKTAGARVIRPLIRQNVLQGTLVHTDGYPAYRKLPQMGYKHRWTDHGKSEFYTPDSATQNIENFWSNWKPRMKGVFRRGISPKYLQLYAQEYAWRYSNRNATSMFWSLLSRVVLPS